MINNLSMYDNCNIPVEVESEAITQAQLKITTQLLESKEQYPYLLSQTDKDPGALVFELIWQDIQEQEQASVTPMTIEEAAAKANTYLKNTLGEIESK